MMTLARVVVSGLVFVFCTGFIPVSGCAKGCGRLGGTAARSGDDFARVGTRYGDDFARGGTRYSAGYADDLARSGAYRRSGGAVVIPVPGQVGDDLAHLSGSSLDNAVMVLPETEGAISAIARKPTSSGSVVSGLDDAGRNFGKDYAKSFDELAITKKQHDELMEAFGTAQDVVEGVIEAINEDDDDAPNVADLTKQAKAKERLQLAALELEAELARVMTPNQLETFLDMFGSPEVVVYRLGKDKPVKRKTPQRRKVQPSKPASDKVVP